MTEVLMRTRRKSHSKRVSRVIGQNPPSPNSELTESFLHPLPSMASSYPPLSPRSCEMPSNWESSKVTSFSVTLRIAMTT